jgi:hypothetical protein
MEGAIYRVNNFFRFVNIYLTKITTHVENVSLGIFTQTANFII